MTAFTLSLQFSPSALQQMHRAGEQVVLVQSQDSIGEVAWQAFFPTTSNTITWEDRYNLYATPQMPMVGDVLFMEAQADDALGSSFQFDSYRRFVEAGPGAEGAVQLINQCPQPQIITFGLAQFLTVNELMVVAPIGTTPLIAQEQAVLHPPQQIYVGVQANVQSGQLLGQIPPNATALDLSSASQTLSYDQTTGKFVQQ